MWIREIRVDGSSLSPRKGVLNLQGVSANYNNDTDCWDITVGGGGSVGNRAVKCASTAALAACTYAAGSDATDPGRGATLTVNANAAFGALDGITPVVGDRLLIKDQAATLQNGIWTLTNAGSATSKWVLTRAVDFDSDNEVRDGVPVVIGQGTALGGEVWYQTNSDPINVGTDPITFAIQADMCTLTTDQTIAGLKTITSLGGLIITQGAATSGAPRAFTVTAGAHTGLTATAENIGARFNMSATKQFATGGIATQREVTFEAPTYAAVGASAITSAATVAISGAPAAGANVTITNSYSLWVQGGLAKFAAGINITGTGTASTSFTAPTFDAAAAGALTIGAATATSVDVSATGETTTIKGVLQVDETLNANGDVNLGNASTDTVTVTGQLDSDITAVKEVNRIISVATSTTASANGANLTVSSAQATAATGAAVAGNGGGMTVSSGAGGAANVAGFAAGVGGTLTLQAGVGGVAAAHAAAASGLGGSLYVYAGAGGAASANAVGSQGGTVGLAAGNGGNGSAAQAAGAGGLLSLVAGNAGTNGGGGGNNGGDVQIRAGNASGAGTDGILYLGDANTSSVEVAVSGITTNVNGPLTVDEATNLNGAIGLGNAVTDELTITARLATDFYALKEINHTFGIDQSTTVSTVGATLTIQAAAGSAATGAAAAANGGQANYAAGDGGAANVAGFAGGTGGLALLVGGTGGAAAAHAAATAGVGGEGNVLGGTGGAASANAAGGAGGQSVVYGGTGGAGSAAQAAGAGGALRLCSGDAGADGGGGGANTGNVTIDAGTPTGAGTAGTVSVGATTATGTTIGRAGQTTNLNGTIAIGTAFNTDAQTATNVAESRSGVCFALAPILEELISIKADALCVAGAIAIVGQPDWPRCLTVRITIAVNAITGGTLDLVGVGAHGQAIAESVSLVTGVSVTRETNNAFATVTSGTVTGLVGGAGAGDNLSVGQSSKLGLVGCKTPASGTYAVHKTVVDNANETVAGVDATYGTVDPTTAPNAAHNYVFYYTYAVTPTQNSHTHEVG